MTRYEERLQRDEDRIRERVQAVSTQVQSALDRSVHALLTGNRELAYEVIVGDAPINRAVREIDRLCHAFIALHLPGAGHLRWVSSVIRVNIELERIGDYAVTISRETVQLSSPPDGVIAREVALIAGEARAMLRQATDAFDERNADAAKATMPMAEQVDRSFNVAFEDLRAEESERSLKDLFGLFAVLNMLGRVSDQSKNICEETVFAATGETKAAKVYRILFVDEENAACSQMAEAMARKAFPGSGDYRSAGRRPAEALHAGAVRFLEEHGVDLGEATPKALELSPSELDDLHVIISLEGAVRSYLPEVPFHTVAFEWDVGTPPASLQSDADRERLEEIYRELASRIRNLMTTLRGDDAP